MNGSPRRHLWTDLRPVVVGLCGAVAVALGYWGFQDADSSLSTGDALYQAIQLFALDSGVVDPGDTPWQLEVARVLAPATAGYAVIAGLLLLVRNRALLWRMRLFGHRHSVVIGLTDTGFALATSLAGAGNSVVAVDPSAASPRASACSERGIPVLEGELTDGALLALTRPDKAGDVVISTGDDTTSLRVLAALEGVTARARRSPRVHVEILRPALWRELHVLALSRAGRPPIEFFSTPDREARSLLEAAAGDLATADRVVLMGAGEVLTRTIVHAARRLLAAGRKPEIQILGPDAAGNQREALAAAPWLETAATVTAAGGADGATAGSATALVCGLDDATALEAARELSAGGQGGVERVWVAVTDQGLAPALAATPLDLNRIQLVPATATALGPELLSESATELIARAKHEDYVMRESAAGVAVADNPSLMPWDELPESLKESNRRFAEGVAERLATLGASLAPLAGDQPRAELTIAPQVLEELARAEHERWVRDLVADGWRPTDGPKDVERKLHPLLVDWGALPEAEREKDRDSMRSLPSLVASAGYALELPPR